jgi:AcrR family transcriptional regulator
METLPGHLQRLPAKEDRFQAEQMSRTQRERILSALAEIVAKRGHQGTTVELIVKRAGVARVTFYANFDNREDCLRACFAEAAARNKVLVVAAAAGEREWPAQVRAGLAAFLDHVAANPALARTCIAESMTAGPDAMERYDEALRSYTPAFRRGREFVANPNELPETLEDSLVGGIVWMVHQRLLRGEAQRVPDLLPTLLEFTLAPYLGEERAAEVAAGR